MAVAGKCHWLQLVVRGNRFDENACNIGRNESGSSTSEDGSRMNHWPFVIASYAIVLISTGMVVLWAYAAMRQSEKKAEQLSKKK